MSRKKILKILIDELNHSIIIKDLKSIGVRPGRIVEIMDNVINIDQSKPSGVVIITDNGNYFINSDIEQCIMWEDVEDAN